MRRITGKKGVSLIVAYVLLIVIALSLSAVVYAWLRGYLPSYGGECPDEAAVVVIDYDCSSPGFPNINITLRNQGRFSVGGFLVKGGNSSTSLAIYPLVDIDHYFEETPGMFYVHDFKPGVEISQGFDYRNLNRIDKVEIQPFMYDDTDPSKDPVLCERAVVVQSIESCP
ncbi:MAG: hypothetical protein ABIE22_05190 [archaeon]